MTLQLSPSPRSADIWSSTGAEGSASKVTYVIVSWPQMLTVEPCTGWLSVPTTWHLAFLQTGWYKRKRKFKMEASVFCTLISGVMPSPLLHSTGHSDWLLYNVGGVNRSVNMRKPAISGGCLGGWLPQYAFIDKCVWYPNFIFFKGRIMYVYICAQEKLKGSCQTLNSSQLHVVGLGVGNTEDSMFTYYLQSLFSFYVL